MTAIATKFQVTAAAAAVAATAAFVPVAAHAAPALQLPAAPQLVGNLAEDGPGIIYYGTVASLQVIGAAIKLESNAYDRQTDRLGAYAAAHPGTFFGDLAAAAVDRKLARQGRLNNITLDYCLNGGSVRLGPYGTVSTGSC